MSDPILTLTSDFGERSPYVAAMKGVIVSIHPPTRVLDLSHRIRPQDVPHASYFLATCVPYFPPGTIHVAVVDPGVGTDRAPLCVRAGGQYLIGPDNGIFTGVMDRGGEPEIWRLTEPRFWRETVSPTFHGRDIFAPVAAHLAAGTDPEHVGTRVRYSVRLPGPPWKVEGNRILGSVQFIDDFGNLITNIPYHSVGSAAQQVTISGRPVHPFRWVRAYGEAEPGSIAVLGSSDGFVEIAEVNGNAAHVLGVPIGAPVELSL
jgi:S-adenosylmethionine hydrolase